jgi:hypothetical protein
MAEICHEINQFTATGVAEFLPLAGDFLYCISAMRVPDLQARVRLEVLNIMVIVYFLFTDESISESFHI